MRIDINSIGYGNPSRRHISLSNANRKFIGNFVYDDIKPPSNSSIVTYGELLYLKELQDQYKNDSFVSFVKEADRDMESIYKKLLRGKDWGYYSQLFKDLASFTSELKIKYNRARPYQLADILNVELYPFDSRSAHSASYPSGHTLQSFVVSEIIAKRDPHLAEEARELTRAIAHSRLVGGYHFPTDNRYALKLGRDILPFVVF